MAEFNPYKLEEEKWTPKNVYEILPPNAVSWSDYDFGQGTDNVDGEAAKKSFIDGFVDFFKDLFGVAGQILGGAIELGGKILGGLVNGVINLVGGIANAIGSIFGGGPSESPYPPMFSPIKANLEAAIQPFKDQIQDSKQKSEELLAEQLDIRGQIAEQVEITRAAVADAKAASERAGVAIGEAEAALSAAEDARETLEEYNEALNKRVTEEFKSAMSKAEEAISQAETANSELVAMNTQLGEITQQASDLNTQLEEHNQKFTDGLDAANSAIDEAVSVTAAVKKLADENKAKVDSAISKAEKANSDLALLSPKVTDAVSKAGKASSDVTALTSRVSTAEGKVATAEQNVATLTPKVTDAVSKSNKAAADVATLAPKVDDAAAKAAKASTDVSALTPKVTAAQNKANQAANDLSTLTPKVTAAQTRADAAYTEAGKVRTDLTPKITAAQTKADTAVADLTKLEPKVTAAQSRADSAYTEAGKVRSEVTPKIEAAQSKGETALAAADKAIADSEFVAGFADDLIPKDAAGKSTWGSQLEPGDVSPPESAFGSERTYIVSDSITGPEPFLPVKGQEVYRLTLWVKRHPESTNGGFSFHLRSATGYAGWTHVRMNFGEWKTQADQSNPYAIIPDDRWGKYTIDFRWPESAGPAYMRVQQNTGGKFFVHDPQVRVISPVDNSVDLAQNDAIKALNDIARQQGEINAAQATANLAQKNFNDNQTKWNLASTNATKANTELLRHQGLINDAQAAANAAQKNFNDNQTKWNTASTNATKALADAAKAQTDINAEQAKFNTFQTDFNTKQTKWNTASTNATKALADSTSALSKIATEQSKLNSLQSDFNTKQIAWNAAVDRSLATQKTVNDNFNKWTEGAATAIEANTKAIALLNNPQAGASLVVTDPTTKRPNWAEKLVEATAAENPDSLPDAYKAVPGTGSNTAKDMWVNIDPTTEYMVSVWVKANKTGSDMTYDMRDQDGNLAFVKSRDVEGFPNVGNSSRPYWIKNVPTKWTQHKSIFTPRATSRKVRFAAPYFNHSSGTVTNATQYVADLQIYPLVPSQAQVDDAQNQAIKANKDLLVEQGRINAEQKKLNDLDKAFKIEQGKINDKQTGISALNTEMGKANKAATEALAKILGINIGGRNLIKESLFQKSTSDYLIHRFPLGDAKPQDGEEVTFSIKANPGEGNTRFRLYNSNGNGSSALFDIFIDEQEPSSDGVYKATGKWKVAGGNTHLNVYAYPSSVKTPNAIEWVKLERGNTATDWSLAPEEIPSQAVVDELQDNAIRKNTTVGKENKKAIDALTEGLDAYAAAADLESLHKHLQDELEKEQDARADLAAEINNYMVESIPRTIIYGSGPQFNDHISAERYKVVAKPGWVGQILLDVTYVSKSDGTQTKRVIENHNVPAPDGSREYDVPNASFGGYQPAYRLDYWVYRGRSIQKALSNSGSYITGSSFTKNAWTRIATHTIKKSNGAVHILWRTRLTRADRGVTYSFDVRVNGTSVLPKSFKGYGPLTSLGDGGATLSFSGNLSVPDNGKIEIYAKASGTTNQASVSSNKGTLSYLELE